MCFSASASFIAGGTLSAVGGTTLKQVKGKKEIPFAAVPLLFGIQQIIEGVLWLAFHHNLILLQSVMTFIFSLFAYVLWPVYIPFAVRLLETDPLRKRILSFLLVMGGAVSLYLLYFIIRYPVTSETMHNSIAYSQEVPFGFSFFWIYAIAGVGSCLVSSQRIIKLFGVFLVISIALSYYFYAFAFVSVWCFFAALLSIIIFTYFYFNRSTKLKTA